MKKDRKSDSIRNITYIYMDEVDYMGDSDFDTVTTIAAERSDIGIFMSSTPTGRRSNFYKACTDKKMGYTEHYHPSTHNPNWGPAMEAEFRSQLSDSGYVHEILAEFGTQETGVFNKEKVDLAMTHLCYSYDSFDYYQAARVKDNNLRPEMLLYSKDTRAPINPFRTMGVDWDKYSAGSSIIILDYDVKTRKFKVIKRIEVPRGEYSYDNAINMIVELNEIYNPSWIYCDRGAGEYQIERLQLIGKENPYTGLHNKVKGWQFKNTLDITNPVTGEITKEPLKPFMVTQLQIAFERDRMMLSEFDEHLHKQLIDYTVEKVGRDNKPTFTSKNEHFVDALGLAYLAFVLEFTELTNTIKKLEHTNKAFITGVHLGEGRVKKELADLNADYKSSFKSSKSYDPTELPGDRPTWMKVASFAKPNSSGGNWGSRSSGNSRGNRSMW